MSEDSLGVKSDLNAVVFTRRRLPRIPKRLGAWICGWHGHRILVTLGVWWPYCVRCGESVPTVEAERSAPV